MAPSSARIEPLGADSIAAAARLILDGRTVAVPTETVYGLAADATNAKAVAAIYETKGRPSFNPLIVHVPSLQIAERFGDFSPEARMLAQSHWPGPLTLVVPLKKGAPIAGIVTAGLPNVAIRVPAHPAMQQLMMAVGRPLAAPSANSSGSISPTRAEHVAKSLGDKVALVIDGGRTDCGLESTIIAATGGPLRLLRPGPVEIPGVAAGPINGVEAPGQLASHYAPGKPLRLDAESAEADEYWIGFGALGGEQSLSSAGNVVEAAARLFDLLHQAEDSDKPRIAVAPIPDRGLGIAINDRLRRAAASPDD